MKKIIVIILLLVYGSATMGTKVFVHYCMDKYVGWSFFSSEGKNCGLCGMEEEDKEGCCKDEHKQFQLKEDQKRSDITLSIDVLSPNQVPPPRADLDLNISTRSPETTPSCHAPPGIFRERLHLLHCLFLI